MSEAKPYLAQSGQAGFKAVMKRMPPPQRPVAQRHQEDSPRKVLGDTYQMAAQAQACNLAMVA